MTTRLSFQQLLVPETALNEPLPGLAAISSRPSGELDLTQVGRENDLWSRFDPTLWEQISATAQRWNTVPVISRLVGSRPSFDPDPGFDPRAHLTGEEWDLPSDVRGTLLQAKSLQELEHLRAMRARFARLDQIARHGPMHPLLSTLLVTVFDPINLVPLGWAAAPVRLGRAAEVATRGAMVRQSVAAGGMVGAAANLLVEPLYQMDDPFRTASDAFLDVFVGGTIGAALGGAVGALVSRRRRAQPPPGDGAAPDPVRDMAAVAEARRVGADPETVVQAVRGAEEAVASAQRIVENSPDTPGRADPHAEPIAKTLGAAVTDQDSIAIRALRTEGLKVVGQSVLERVSAVLRKLPLGVAEWPGLTLATSRFDASRRFIASVADTGIQTRAQRGTLDEAALEAAFQQAEALGWHYGREEFMRFAKAQLEQGLPMADLAPLYTRIALKHNTFRLMIQDIYAKLRSELDAAGIEVPDRELDVALAQQAHFMAAPEAFGGESPVRSELRPHLERTIREARDRILTPLIEDARRAGVIGEDVTPDPSYWPLVFDRETILLDPGRFRQALIDMFRAEKARAEAVVVPYEQAMERWRKEGDFNRKSRMAGFEARRAGHDLNKLVTAFVHRREQVGKANRRFSEIESAIRRGGYLAEGQTTEQWAKDLASRFVKPGGEWKNLYESVRKQELERLQKGKLELVLRREKLTPEEQKVLDANVKAIDAVIAAEAEIDARNAKQMANNERLLTPEQEHAIYLNHIQAAGLSQGMAGFSPRRAADDAVLRQFGVTTYEIELAHRWLKTRKEQLKEQVRYNAFRAANNAEWKRLTKPFVKPEDRHKHPDGYDMPTGFRGTLPIAPPDYHKHKRKIRGETTSGEPARLADDESIAKEADEIVRNLILGTDPHRFAQLGLRGHLKGRGLEPDWRLLSPFLRRSFSSVLDGYVTMVPRDIETFKTFGDIREEAFIKPLTDEAHRMQNVVLAPELVDASKLFGDMKALRERALKMSPEERQAEAAQIGRQMVREADLMRALVAQARGVYIQPAKTLAEAKFRAALQTGMNMIYVQRMGSGALAQLGDFTKAVLHNGLVRFMGKYFVQLGRTLGELGRSDPDSMRFMREFGVGGEGRLLDHQRLLYDVAPAEHQGPFGRFISRITPQFSRFTLMPFMNDMMRRAAVNLVQDDLYKLLTTTEGRSADIRALIAQAGLRTEDIAKLRQIAKEFAEPSPTGAVDFHLEKWAHLDWELADRFRAAIHLAAQRSVIVPTAADAPMWTQTNLGRVVMQFKRFVLASLPQLLIPAFQSPGLRKLEVAVAAAIFGTMSTVLRDLNAQGKLKERNTAEWVLDSLDASGLLSALSEFDATLFKLNPNLSARYLLIGETPAHFRDRTSVAAFLGPLAGFVETTVARAVDLPLKLMDPNREVNARNIAAFRQMLPYQNHIILRHPLDVAEAWLGGRQQGPTVEWIGR